MDSDLDSDLALLDSLLLHTENQNEEQACDNNLFLCSPLVAISRSKPKPPDRNTPPSHLPETDGNVSAEDPGKSTCSSLNGSVNKENVMNDNKMEGQKLSLEPQKMKRKKKGGGYNLRKSLAWDRAFFTEEGVLNSLELSRIRGDQSIPGEERMSVIHEEEGDSSVLHSIEENLFKQLSTSTSSEHGNDSVRRLPKRELLARNGVAPGSAVKRKVLAVHDSNRSGSKRSGGPRPVPSSSPAIMKVASKDTKVTKTPVPKPDCTFTSASTTWKDTPNAGIPKRNQNVHPIAALRKNSGPKVPLNNNRSVAPSTKNVSANKSSGAGTSARKLRKPLTKSESQKQLPVSEAKNAADIIHEKQVTPSPMLSYSGYVKDSVSGSGKRPGYNSQNASCSLNNRQNVQLQTLKPSGLRMPSPSLGFFEQAKPTPSPSLIQKSTLPCNLLESKTPIMRKVGASNCISGLKPPLPPQRKPEIVKNILVRSNLTEGKLNSNAKTNSKKSEMKLKKVSTDSGKISMQGQLHTTSEFTFGNDHADENTASIEDSESQTDEGRFLFDNETSEKLVDVDASGGDSNSYHKSIDLRSFVLEGSKVTCTHSTATQLSGGSKICYLKTGLREGKVDYLSNTTPLIHKLESVDAHHGEHRASQMKDETSNYVHDANREQPGEQIQLVKAFVREIDQTSQGSMIPSTNNVTLIEEGEIISRTLDADTHVRLDKASGGNSSASVVAYKHETQPWEQVEQNEPVTCQVVETFNERQAEQLCLSNLFNEGVSSVVLHDIVCLGEVREGCQNELQGSCRESRSEISEEAKDDSGLDDDIAIDREDDSSNISFYDSKILNESAEINENDIVFDDMKYEHADEVESSDAHFQRDTSQRDDYRSDHSSRIAESTHSNHSVRLCVPQSDGSCGTEQESLGEPSSSISQFRDSSLQQAVMVIPNQPLTEGQSSSIREIAVAEYDQSSPKYYQLQPQLTSLLSVGTGEDCTDKNTDMESCTSQPHPIVQATRLRKRNYTSDPKGQPDQEKLCETDQLTGEKDEDTAATSLVMKLGSNDETEIRHHNSASYNETSIQSDLSTVVNEITDIVTGNLEEHCAVQNDQISSQRITGSSEASEEKGQILSEEAKSVNRNTENCDSDILHAGDFDESGNKSKLEPLSIKPPKNAIPFSDEWLAAFEAAGEEVLTLKSGAVQNSPPDKPHQEPGPWSPVKRKSQVIGPYDCTKYTNGPPSTSQ